MGRAPMILTRTRLTAAMLLVLAGCDRAPKRVDVSGTVTYRGKPVPAGVILFDPDVTKKHDGPQGFAEIKNGQFDTAQGGRGVAPGPHVVRVQGMDGVPARELPLGRPLFPDYETPADIAPGQAPLTIDVPA